VKRTRQQKRQAANVDLRAEAAGRTCQIRLEGCTGEPVCLCHVRLSGISGMGLKAPDLLGAHGCASCHEKVDSTERHNLQTQFDFLCAVLRTQAQLIREGKVTW
jgi:hypothetical protein